MDKKTFDLFQERFFANLDKKTGWGKEELKKMFLETLVQTLLDTFKV